MEIVMLGMSWVRSIDARNFLVITLQKAIAALIVPQTLVIQGLNSEKAQIFGASAKSPKKKFGVYRHPIGYGKRISKVSLKQKNY